MKPQNLFRNGSFI